MGASAREAGGRPQTWREVRLTYAVPPDLDQDEIFALEEAMWDAAARVLGCRCDETTGPDEPCAAGEWTASAGPLVVEL